MRFLTDRKRAQGLGSSRNGTQHHWQMMASSLSLIFIVPAFVITFGLGLGGTYEEVLAYYSRPLPAIIIGLSAVVLNFHLVAEAKAAAEDYMHGIGQKLVLIALDALAYTLSAVALFALARLAL